MTEFLPCAKRDNLIAFDRSGDKRRLYRCAEKKAEHYFEEVTPEICEACPLRREVTERVAAKVRYQPPLVEDTRTVRSRRPDDNADPLWEPCKDRQNVEVPSCCGASMLIKVCASPECFRNGSEVTREQCRECLQRRAD